MKKLILTIFLIFTVFLGFSQKAELKKIESKGNLQQVTLFYENGTVMQQGFYTNDGKLHGCWESFFKNGSRQCVAFYDKGVKVGTWMYYSPHKRTKVIYEKNKIVSVEELEPEQKEKDKI
jgi:antitoxin component YwqK of YwqJK toxin-antitoxin module